MLDLGGPKDLHSGGTNFWGHTMSMSINGNRPSKYVTIPYGLFYKNIQICRLFSTNLPEITTSLKRTEVSGSGQEERRLRTNTAIPKLSDIQDWSRSSLQSKACSVDTSYEHTT